MPAQLQPSETGAWHSEPVCDPAFWRKRLDESDGELHRSIFNGSVDQFQVVEAWQRARLAEVEIADTASILDAGCGYGRLLDWMPGRGWHGEYLGLDICPEFIALARERCPGRRFEVADLRDLSAFAEGSFDLAVVLWMHGMVRNNLGEEAWSAIERELARVSRQVVLIAAPD